MEKPDIKPRSRVVTDGIEATTSRGMLRAVGMGDDDWDKPLSRLDKGGSGIELGILSLLSVTFSKISSIQESRNKAYSQASEPQ
jgi:hypothetical protein